MLGSWWKPPYNTQTKFGIGFCFVVQHPILPKKMEDGECTFWNLPTKQKTVGSPPTSRYQ